LTTWVTAALKLDVPLPLLLLPPPQAAMASAMALS
jgi:hypothetical protein